MNDLVGILALPAVWSGSEPHRILEIFLDALLATLDLDFLYARVQLDSHKTSINALKTTQFYGTSHSREDLRHALNQWPGEIPQHWPEPVFRCLGEQEVSVFPIRMGIGGELGLIVAGSRRLGFPEQTESLVLGVAANQLAIGLQQALLLSEQKRVATELDLRVAERTRELAEANEELQLQVGLLQHLPVSAWTLKPDGTPDFVNRVWLEYSGQTLEFVRSHPEAWMAAIHPEDREKASRAFWDGVRSGQGFAIESRYLRCWDGTYRWHLQQAVPLCDAEGKVLKFVGTTTDIDDQKRAEVELRASETNLRQTVNSIPGLICTMNPAGEIEELNQPLLEYFGKTPDELKSWRMTDAVHPDDLAEVIKTYTYSITTGTPYEIENRCRRADGVYRWFQVRASAVHDSDSSICGWYVLLTDIDDRKRMEEALRVRELNLLQITETIPEMLWSASPNGAIDYCNGRLLDYTGVSPEHVMRDGWKNLLHPGDVEPAVEVWESCVKAGAPYRIEARVFHALDRTYRWCVARALPLLDQEGRIAKWHGTVVDMHDWKQAQEELRNTQAELARVMRVMTVGQLTASIAHEVSQPLSGVITNASTCLRMLKSDPPNIDGARETVQRTIRDGNRASEVITRLRTLFSKKQIDVEPLDLNEATREVIALLSGELQRNNVVLKQDFSDHLPAINGDRIQLQQVILNLIRNGSDAMDAVNDLPRQLLIKTETDGNHVTVSVQDSGVGFSPEISERLFESFFTTKHQGMGIGLSVSRSIVEAHHGRLWAARNAGPGATFAFSIPQYIGNPSDRRTELGCGTKALLGQSGL
ncbi:MAG: PAS domain-containing protein [Terracidiphilus sp.]